MEALTILLMIGWYRKTLSGLCFCKTCLAEPFFPCHLLFAQSSVYYQAGIDLGCIHTPSPPSSLSLFLSPPISAPFILYRRVNTFAPRCPSSCQVVVTGQLACHLSSLGCYLSSQVIGISIFLGVVFEK